MGAPIKHLSDVARGPSRSRLRLLGPFRYLSIRHPEKTRYDFYVPVLSAGVLWAGYLLVTPKPAIFGEAGLVKFTRDLLIMAVPFMIGALATVAMSSPGTQLDRRPAGGDIWLDGERISLRQFVCYLLGYLSALGIVTLAGAVLADLMRPLVLIWITQAPYLREYLMGGGVLILIVLLSFLTVGVLWALYFLSDIVNRKA